MAELPDKAQILAWIEENPTQSTKRDIARAFGIKGAARIDLKRMLKELEQEGLLQDRKGSRKKSGELPPVTVLTIAGTDGEGELFARPAVWEAEEPAPMVLIAGRQKGPAPGEGDRVLARLEKTGGEPYRYAARIIRVIGAAAPAILGIFRATPEGGRIQPIEKGADREWRVPSRDAGGARDGELVEATQTGPRDRMGLPVARITARLGDPAAPRAVSLIAIHQHGIPFEFPPEVLAEADKARPADPAGRADLRDVALVTIDPADARDHDDAVAAMADPDSSNPGGHIVWVAIADVAHYVRPGSALDREARRRGNSTYFPDRVVPMLPDSLSGDLCSLHEDEDRPCLAVQMVLDAHGHKLRHRFVRAIMRSRASLTYAETQDAAEGRVNDKTAPLAETVIAPLFAAYRATRQAREGRQPLDLDLPERRIVLDEEGKVISVAFRDRLDAHRMIEEFMILANVCAAEELLHLQRPLLFRVHEEPSPEKLEALREIAQTSGFTLAKGQVLQTRHLNSLLSQAEGTDFDELINISTLRAMTQAYYNRENFGHFGLALRSYAHFTSPIRRYADLVVHRALISAHGWGDDGLSAEEIEQLDETAQHISETERRSMEAERDTTDRYLAAFLSDRVGHEMAGRISGIARFGVFVKLDETGADGLIPMRALGDEYFHFDREAQQLTGADSGQVIGIAQCVTVRLAEAVPTTGGLLLELLSIEGESPVRRRRRSGRRPVARKAGAAARKAQKQRRKVKRRRR